MIQGYDAVIQGVYNNIPSRKIPQDSKLLPDWGGIYSYVAKQGERPANILLGDTMLSYKWNSWEIELGIMHKADEIPSWLWLIMQVFTYCIIWNSRYGYIITDEEVVALRIRAPTSTQDSFDSGSVFEKYGTVEYACIDYDNTQMRRSGDRLTLNMALWWLHLLAAKDRSIKQIYRPLEEECLPTPSKRRDSLFRPEIDQDQGSVDGTKQSNAAPPDLPDNSFQVSQVPNLSSRPFSETETPLVQSGPSGAQMSSKRSQDESRDFHSSSKRKNWSKRRMTK
jgi:hypothetical protein